MCVIRKIEAVIDQTNESSTGVASVRSALCCAGTIDAGDSCQIFTSVRVVQNPYSG